MAKMSITVSRIDRGVMQFISMLHGLDVRGARKISGREVKAFSGRGKALLTKVYRYAGHIDSKSDIANAVVDLAAFRAGVERLGSALKRIAVTQGDKDGRLGGTASELGRASASAQSLARWIHANVR